MLGRREKKSHHFRPVGSRGIERSLRHTLKAAMGRGGDGGRREWGEITDYLPLRVAAFTHSREDPVCGISVIRRGGGDREAILLVPRFAAKICARDFRAAPLFRCCRSAAARFFGRNLR